RQAIHRAVGCRGDVAHRTSGQAVAFGQDLPARALGVEDRQAVARGDEEESRRVAERGPDDLVRQTLLPAPRGPAATPGPSIEPRSAVPDPERPLPVFEDADRGVRGHPLIAAEATPTAPLLVKEADRRRDPQLPGAVRVRDAEVVGAGEPF